MAVVTISRELGSGGTAIGKQVAQALGYHFVDKNLVGKILEEYGIVQLDELYRSASGFWARFSETNLRIVTMLNRVLCAMAQHGDVVIVGRGGFVVLNNYADVLNVRIQAPYPVRLKRLKERDGLSATAPDEQLEACLRESDRERAAFIQGFYNTRSDLTDAFHLVIDTGMVSPETAAQWIAEATRALESRTTNAGQPTAREIEVDTVLARTVANALLAKQMPVIT
jgi:cytidylate kinase